MTLYRVISEEWSVFWEMLVWRIGRKKNSMTVYLFLIGYWYRAV